MAGAPKQLAEAILRQLGESGVAVVDGAFGLDFASSCRAEGERMQASGRLRLGEISKGLSQGARAPARDDHITWLKRTTRVSVDSAAATAAAAAAEPEPSSLRQLVARMESLSALLDARSNLTLDSPSFMLACYLPGGGARYVKHRDAAPVVRPGRKLTLLYYLNLGWQPEHGGQLRIWPLPAAAAAAAAATGAGGCSSAAAAADLAGLLHAVMESSLLDDDGDKRAAATAGEGSGGGGGGGGGGSCCYRVIEPTADRLVCFLSPLEHEVLPSEVVPRFAVTTWLANKRDLACELFAEEAEAAGGAGSAGGAGGGDSGGGGGDSSATAGAGDGAAFALQKMMLRMALLKTMQAARDKQAAGSCDESGGGAPDSISGGGAASAGDGAVGAPPAPPTGAGSAHDAARALALRTAMRHLRSNRGALGRPG
jgi:SM-20-related protein